MTKQGKIKRGLAKQLYGEFLDGLDVDDKARGIKFGELGNEVRNYYLYIAGVYLAFLHSQGVVIKVDRELPKEMRIKVTKDMGLDCLWNSELVLAKPILRELGNIGYVATIPLIEGADK